MSDDGVPYGALVVEAPLANQAASFDAFAIHEVGVPQPVLMETAGRQAAQLLQSCYPGGAVVGLVGGGNNGGDALVALRTLQAWGRTVRAVFTSSRPGSDALLHGWELPRLEAGWGDPGNLTRDLEGAVVIDGILGTGLQGPPRPAVAAVIEALNVAQTRGVVALDTPSGADGNTGMVPGAAVQADLTVCFGWPKLGVLLHPARTLAGRIMAVEIGFPPTSDSGWARVITPAWAEAQRPRRAPDDHKNRVGSLCLLAGSAMAGAAVLAARAAFRAGCGLVRVVGNQGIRTVLLEACPEALWIDGNDDAAVAAAVAASDALAAGPGLGTDDPGRRQFTRFVAARSAQPLVVDADGLTLLAPAGSRELSGPVLVTPHPGEMARLLGCAVPAVQADRPAAARRLSDATGWIVLLKGAPSLLTGPDGPLWISMSGSSDLAVAGMGDVLTGVAASLAAQGLPLEAAGAVALHWTGRAAAVSALGASLMPSDVVDALPGAMASPPDGGKTRPPFVTFDQPAPR